MADPYITFIAQALAAGTSYPVAAGSAGSHTATVVVSGVGTVSFGGQLEGTNDPKSSWQLIGSLSASGPGSAIGTLLFDQDYAFWRLVTSTISVGAVAVCKVSSDPLALASSAPGPVVAVTGASVVGSQLTASIAAFTAAGWTGTASYQWRRSASTSDLSYANSVAISGATAAAYTQVSADEGRKLYVDVTGLNPPGTAAGVTAPAVVVGVAPSIITVPVVTSIPTVGQLISAQTYTPGTYGGTPAPVTAFDSWLLDGSVVSTGYTLAAGDVGKGLEVKLAVSNASGTIYPTAVAVAVQAASTPIGGIKSVTVLDATPIDVQSGVGVDGSGWVAVVCLRGITDINGTLDPSKLTLTVMDAGFLADGSTTVVTRTISGVAFMRRPFPNGNTRMISTDGQDLFLHITLDDWIYSGSSIVGAQVADGFYTGSVAWNASTRTNNSVIAYTKPVFAWINPQNERAGTSQPIEAVAFHRHAKNQQQVACIKYQVSDGTNQGADTLVSATQLSTRVTRGNIPEVWAASVDMSGMAQASTCNINAKAYPWIGDASAVLDLSIDGPAWPTAYPNTQLRVFCDKTGAYGGAFAYVKAGATGGAVSAIAATAQASPFPTVTAAMNAVKTWNNANKGHNDHGGATIRLMDDGASGPQTHSISAAPTDSTPVTHYIIEKDPATSATITITFTAQSSFPSMVYWRNLTYAPGITYSWIGPNTASSQLVADNCTIDNPANRALAAWYDFKYLLNINHASGTGGSWNTLPLTASAVSVMAGYESNTFTSTLDGIAVIGSKCPYAPIAAAVRGVYGYNNRILYNNKVAAIVITNLSATQNLYGVAVIQNACEWGANPAANVIMNLFADIDLTTISNLVDQHNTAAGERASRMYNDILASKAAPSGVVKRGSSKYNVWDNYNSKGDYFSAGNGDGSVGAWSYQYSVGNVGNISLFGAVSRAPDQEPKNFGADAYLGMAWLPSSEYNLGRTALGFSQAQIMAMFGNWTTKPQASPVLGGDYRPKATATFIKNRVPAGAAVLRYDITGAARLNNGVGAAGAYEAAP